MAGSRVTPSIRALEDERLKVAIRATRTSSRETYGVRRLQPEPAAEITFSTRNRSDRRSGGLHWKHGELARTRRGWSTSPATTAHEGVQYTAPGTYTYEAHKLAPLPAVAP